MTPTTLTVSARYAPEAGVWTVTASDIPGLVAEAETPRELCRRVETLTPKLRPLASIARQSGNALVLSVTDLPDASLDSTETPRENT